MPIREIDADMLRYAKSIFSDYKNRGVILNGEFEDMSWILSNEVECKGLTVLTFEGGSQKKGMGWIGCSYHKYLECVKAYIMLNLGEIGLSSLQEIARALKRLAITSVEDAVAGSKCITHIIALLQIIPGGNEQRDYVIEELEEKIDRISRNRRKGQQRSLADFKSYLRFHDILTEYWQRADEKQKLFYFPLYFWWNLTAILPLRPMEFLLTPRNCLHTNGSEYILTVRRTKLKGRNEKIMYCIAEDYEQKEYSIPAYLAFELQLYIGATEKMKSAEIDTLFRQSPHCCYLGTTIISSSRYYTYAYLKTCLRRFYSEVIEPSHKEVSHIQLGDTRHLAMTNLIISGGSPVICRELAGHSGIDISSHYYSNISNLVECVTLERCRKSKADVALISGSMKYPVSKPVDMTKVSGGWCNSQDVKEGRIDDCLKITDEKGHIGECRCCCHYYPSNQGIRLEFLDAKSGKEQVDADSQYLIRMIELVRNGLGYTEDIGSALLRLQRSSNHYGRCLWEKINREELL